MCFPVGFQIPPHEGEEEEVEDARSSKEGKGEGKNGKGVNREMWVNGKKGEWEEGKEEREEGEGK